MGLRSVASASVLRLSASWSRRDWFWASREPSVEPAVAKPASARSRSAWARSPCAKSLRARATSRSAWARPVRAVCTWAALLAAPEAATLRWLLRSSRSSVANTSPAFTTSPSCSARGAAPGTSTWPTLATRPGTRKARSNWVFDSSTPE